MKKLLSVAVASIALITAPSVSAQTFSTTAGTYTFSSTNVNVQKGSGLLLTCNLRVGFETHADRANRRIMSMAAAA